LKQNHSKEVDMIRILGVAVVLAMSWSPDPSETTTKTWTGWFSDKQCARVTPDEAPRPNGTACVKKCLADGSPAVFISEQAKGVYLVVEQASVAKDVGYHVEITGEVDEKAKTVSLKSVKRLSAVPAICLARKAVKK
jgi:hypothetical protein